MQQLTDTLFDALADEHRRRILFSLTERNPRDELPIYIDAPPDVSDAGDTASIEQYHVHLPKLDEYDFINWDPSSNAVEAGNRFEEIEPVLELLRDNRDDLPVTNV